MNIVLQPVDWLQFLLHFLSISLLAVGGPMTLAPDMHRYLVGQHHWLNEMQFNASIAIAQAAPGPNVLFVALLGWNVGLNASGGLAAGWHGVLMALLGVAVALVGSLTPSLLLAYHASRWAHRNRHLRAVRAFKAGMSPIVVAMLLSTGWLLSAANSQPAHDWQLWLLTAATTLIVWRTRVHLLWLIAVGGVLGVLGLV